MRRHRAFFSFLSVLAAGACTDSTSTGPTSGAVEVVIVTLGVDVDPDGYQVILNQKPPVAVGVNDTLAIDVRDGNYTVGLDGLAANCVLQGAAERNVTVAGSHVATATFTVSCGALTGVIRVEAVTVGDAADPDGYQVTLSSPAPGNTMPLSVNGWVDVPGLIWGSYVVTLGGLSSSCVASGGTSRSVAVRTGLTTRDTAYASFQIACLGGVVDIRAPTTGADKDTSYTISVDGGQAGELRSTDSLSIPLEVGDHTFYLSGLEPNCSVQGPNPITVTIGHGARTSLSFAIVCVPNVAAARISAVMTGGTIDTSVRIGVDLTCDYWYYYCTYYYESPLPHQGSVLVALSTGTHRFQLLDLAENCVVAGGTTQSINLPASDTVDVVFNVTCSPAGTVRVTTPTTGTLPDDGYVIFLDNLGGVEVLADQSYTFEAVSAGQHIVALGDVSPACRVAGENPRAITVSFDAITDIVFQVSCDPDASLVIAAPTTGGDPDNSYLAFVDNSSIGATVPANGNVTVPVYGGLHTVTLQDVAFNCTVAVSQPFSVSVPAGGQATATIPVNCTQYTGTARFTITTTGPNQPTILNLDYDCTYYYGCSRLAVPANGVASVDLSAGTYLFSFASIPSNCTMSPANAVQLSIAVGVTTDAAFTLVCH